MDTSKVDLIIKYILATAGQEDFENQELGPIHLVKYVYLADLAYAEANNGETMTGAEWQFYHYGPWSYDVYSRIETVVKDVNATKRIITSYKYESDGIRWKLLDDELYESLRKLLPSDVCRAVKDAIHEYGSDTTGLLHHVYTTWPMLHAAPLERLSFIQSKVATVEESTEQRMTEDEHKTTFLSKKEIKQRKEKIAALKEGIRNRLVEQEKNKKLVTPDPAPRYDEIFFNGLSWLDELAGTPILPTNGEIVFSEEVWKSKARSDEGIS
ncbi:MAG: hypothetical protein AB2L22_17905 [Syntrophales bacterium]